MGRNPGEFVTKMSLLGFLRRKTGAQAPEYSQSLRRVILLAMLVPLLALGRVYGSLWPHLIIAAAGIGLGHWYSFHNLKRNSQLVRGIMFVAIHLALGWMFIGLASGQAVPQAQFAVFAQAITSFDLRYRRSLFNTLIHSLANLYIAASLSRTYELGLYLLLFGGLVLAALFIADRETGRQQAQLRPQARVTPAGRHSLTLFSVGFGALALLAIFTAFIFIPRLANNPIIPPFTFNVPLQGGVKSEIINPGVPLVQINGWSNERGDYYYGFDTNLDLRYRGGLSDAVVMYVRSPSRSYWRSHSYDFYDGVTWSQSNKHLREIEPRFGVRFDMPQPLGAVRGWSEVQSGVEAQQIVQSFTLVRDQPNLVFAAYRPAHVFITAEHVSLDGGDGIRLPEGLKAGLTYSVISERPDFEPELLRQDGRNYPTAITARYLQLPPISGRVKNLAGRLAQPYDNPYDQVMALTRHLTTGYPYNFFPPPHPPGAEVVDTFLFEDKEGVCEQYVTALVVMARSLGIPARIAVGYGAGDYNPVTNYYEVRLSHAHSWAEVYFPSYGWVPFDPTPGWTPQPYPTPVQNWLFGNSPLLDLNFPGLPVGDLAAQGLAGLLFFIPFLVGSTLLVGLVLLGMFLYGRLRGRWARRRAERYSTLETDPTRRLILKLYRQAVKLLSRRNYPPRRPWETLGEYARRVNRAALTRLTQAAEVAAYRVDPPDSRIVTEAGEAFRVLKEELR